MQKECKLPNDVWVLIGLHLKPRHLAKLIRVSTKIKSLVDNNAYWTRVAAHAVWREKECLEIMACDTLNFTPIDVNLYDMLGLDRGYYWGMELFLGRLNEAIEFFSKNDEVQMYLSWWEEMKAMSLEEKTREGIKAVAEDNYQKTPFKELGMSMKEVAKKRISYYHVNRDDDDKKFNKFVTDLEDDPMPAAFKREVMSKVKELLWDCWKPNKTTCPTDIALGICKFGSHD
jgi:hypothetical protein